MFYFQFSMLHIRSFTYSACTVFAVDHQNMCRLFDIVPVSARPHTPPSLRSDSHLPLLFLLIVWRQEARHDSPSQRMFFGLRCAWLLLPPRPLAPSPLSAWERLCDAPCLLGICIDFWPTKSVVLYAEGQRVGAARPGDQVTQSCASKHVGGVCSRTNDIIARIKLYWKLPIPWERMVRGFLHNSIFGRLITLVVPQQNLTWWKSDP